MRVAAIATFYGMDQADSGVRKALVQISGTPDPEDAVHLSYNAATLSVQQTAYSLELKAQKVQDQIASITVQLSG